MVQRFDPFVECKALRHAMYLADVERRSSFGTPTWFRCERCGTLRVDIIDSLGNLAARYYTDYPEGYRGDRLPIADYRLQLLAKARAGKLALDHDLQRGRRPRAGKPRRLKAV